ncbi:DUF5067 domain-containing protein [Staphylococcus aureus]|uniref:DUF5067 domain-containing protein n=1 Tax=Staphylococcus aureus TaxID=1280 RepID=UPI00397C86E7|nr:DUF5067 domain-containing protein [Staphylococcus aureus]
MKKVMGILLASTLILGACGHHQHSAKKESTSHKKKENEDMNEELKEFKNKKDMDIKIKGDTIVSEKFDAKIKDSFIINEKDEKKKYIAFKMEITAKKDDKDLNPSSISHDYINITQDDKSTVNNLKNGYLLSDKKYKDWTEHNQDQIKKDKTAQAMFIYELRGDGNINLNVHKYAEDKTVDSKTFKFSKLKTEDFSHRAETREEIEKKEKEFEEEYKKERDKEKEKEKQKEDDSALNEV